MDIIIRKYIKGSKPDAPGDVTLAYTEEMSSSVNNVCESFSDSGYLLSPDHATFLSLYSPNDDLYTFVHIQAQQWIFGGGSRRYAYRGGFAVARKEVENNKGYKNIINSLPKIAEVENSNGKIAARTKLNSSSNFKQTGVQNLAALFQNTMSQGKYLFLILDKPAADEAKGDGIFKMQEFQMLLDAIDCMKPEMRQYATFSFLADSNFHLYLKETFINVRFNDCAIQEPQNSIEIEWNKAIHTVVNEATISQVFTAKKEKSLYTVSTLLNKVSQLTLVESMVEKKNYDKISTENWTLWNECGHNISEITISNEKEYNLILMNLPEDMAEELAKLNKPKDVKTLCRCMVRVLNNDADKDAKTKLKALERADYNIIIADAQEEDMKNLFKYVSLIQKIKKWRYIANITYEPSCEWIDKNYPIAVVKDWNNYCSHLDNYKSFKKFVLQYVTDWAKDYRNADLVTNELIKYVESLDYDGRKEYGDDAKLFIKAVCKGLKRRDCFRIKKALYPEKMERNKLLTVAGVAMFAGILFGAGSVYFLMNQKTEEIEPACDGQYVFVTDDNMQDTITVNEIYCDIKKDTVFVCDMFIDGQKKEIKRDTIINGNNTDNRRNFYYKIIENDKKKKEDNI